MKVRLAIAVVLASYAVFVCWFVGALGTLGDTIDKHYQDMANQPLPYVTIVHPEDARYGLVVPTWRWLENGGQWQLVSKTAPIDIGFTPKSLETLSIPYGDWIIDNRLHAAANKQLAELAHAAEKAGYPIIVTSSFRSSSDQQELLKSSIAEYGAAWANEFIATPGHSEHQLGLAVDLSSYTPACKANFSNCNLGEPTAQWLATHAPQYGFIVRYPEDKVAITGVSHESWHFRFVGERLATYLDREGLVLDQVIPLILEKKP
jgi:LAS superfamily LD-carboxypeptidase LdcB